MATPSYSANSQRNRSTVWTNCSDENRTDKNELREYNTTELAVIGTVLATITLVAFVGNCFVFTTITTSEHLKRKKSNLIIASLALSDMLLALIVMSLGIVKYFRRQWDFGSSFCLFWICCDITLSTASINHLCLVCMERYAYIIYPLHYEMKVSERKVMGMIVIVWLVSASIAFVPLYAGWHKSLTQDTPVDPTQCDLDISFTYAIVSASISFYIPCTVMFCLYYHIYLVAIDHARRLKQEPPMRVSVVASQHYNLKATITVGVMFGAFFICWMPFFVASPLAASCPSCVPPILFWVLEWLGWANSSVNPFIYSFMNREMRRDLLRLCCQRPARVEQTSPQTTRTGAKGSIVSGKSY